MYDAVLSETVTITGHEGDAIEAYSARPLTPGPVGGVVVIHHLPGYDRQTKEFARPLTPGPVGGVVGEPPAGHPLAGWQPIVTRTPSLSCPLLGLFGKEDKFPSPEHVAELGQALREAGKTYEFYSYDGANHGFMQVDSARYHPQSAVDAWGKILDWFGRYLAA